MAHQVHGRIEPFPMFEGYRAPSPRQGHEADAISRALRAFNEGELSWCFGINCIGFPCDEHCLFSCANDPSEDARDQKCNAFADWLLQHVKEVSRPGYLRRRGASFAVGTRKMEE